MAVWSIINKSALESTNRIDAEYYQPEYLNLVNKISSFPKGSKRFEDLDCRIVSGPFGSSLKSSAYLKKGIPFIRISDLDSFFIRKDELIYISEEDNKRLRSSQLKTGDLVLSKVGNTIGIVSIITEDIGRANISENNIGIKLGKIGTDFRYFLLAFLNSKSGRSQILRKISGNAQPKLNVKDIYDVIFCLPSNKVVKNVNGLVIKAKEEFDLSNSLYAQAETLLLDELGLTNLTLKDVLFYTARLSDVRINHRLDAEYFQPKYDYLIQKLQRFSVTELGKLVTLKKGIEVGSEAYQDKGIPFIRVSDLTKYSINLEDPQFISNELYQQLKNNYQPKKDEMLLTKDATLGIAYVLDETIKGIIAGGVVRLKVTGNIEKQYLALVINSIVGREQIKRAGGGSVIIHWKPDQIKSLIVPVLNKGIQRKIADLVTRSHQARQKAKALLDEAKNKVEDLIEKE